MKVTYDPEVDVLRILFRDVAIDESDEDKPGVILDYDKEGNIGVGSAERFPARGKPAGCRLRSDELRPPPI
jgi:hypothetical protein